MAPHDRTRRHAARRAHKSRRDQAEIGIGTMIVFIAAVIVAAVAAAVLINTSGQLQEKAARTGREATQQVSSNIFIREISGEVNDGHLDNITLLLSLAPGATEIDLERVIIRWIQPDGAFEFNRTDTLANATAANSTRFYVTEPMTADSDPAVLRSGDLVKITMYNRNVDPRTEVSITIIPEIGAAVQTGFRAPASYGLNQFIILS